MVGEGQTPRFIIDEPAEQDFLQTHSPVALAIASAIATNPGLKVVGVLGRWGSGKSTIVREVCRRLAGMDQNFRTFTYDAWLHQHDPIRRSFLESIAIHLSKDGTIDGSLWRDRIDKLSGALKITRKSDTPLVTSEAKQLFFCIAIISMGLLIAKDNFKPIFLDKNFAPALFEFRVSLFMIILPVMYWLLRFVYLKSKGRETNIFPRVLLNKEISATTLVIREDPEPTSIEFGRAFRDMMKESSENGHKIVIVIDNIDRLSENEALDIWANIRSFFLSSDDDNAIDTESFHPVVILPVDYKSISQMFSMNLDVNSGDRLARSFINKTFDVTFVVPSPVISDWKRYLREKTKECFGDDYKEEMYFSIQQFSQEWFSSSATSITPREINKILNGIVALVLQRGDPDIDFDAIAYFSINREEIEKDINKVIGEDDNPLRYKVLDWKRQIAALYFGVSVADAAQVLMEEPIRQAILSEDIAALQNFREIGGYGEIFEEQTRSLPIATSSNFVSLETITNAALLLEEHREETLPLWQEISWRNIVRAFNNSTPRALREFDRRTKPFWSHVSDEDAARFISSMVEIAGEILSQPRLTIADVKDVGLVGQKILTFANQHGLSPPIFEMEGDATQYLSRLAALRATPEVQMRLHTEESDDAIIGDLVRRVEDAEQCLAVPEIVTLLTSESADVLIDGPLEEGETLINAAEGTARVQAAEAKQFRAGVQTLAAFNGDLQEPAIRALERLVDDGTFANKIGGVVLSNDGDTLAIMLAFMVRRGVDIRGPVQGSWRDTFKQFGNLVLDINKYLDLSIRNNESQLDMFLTSYDNGIHNRILIEELFNHRVRSGRLGQIYPSKILSNIYDYSKIIEWRLKDRFTELLAESYDNFIPSVKSVPWTEGVYETATRLNRKGGKSADRFNQQLLERVKSEDSNTWESAIISGAEPFRTFVEFIDRSKLKMGIKSELAIALTRSASHLLSKAAQTRWFDLANMLTPQARRKVMVELAAQTIDRPPSEKLNALQAGGVRFLTEGGLFSDPKVAIASIVLPLSKSQKGRAWLRDRRNEIRQLVTAADGDDRAMINGMVQKFLASANAENRHWAEMVRAEWGLT